MIIPVKVSSMDPIELYHLLAVKPFNCVQANEL